MQSDAATIAELSAKLEYVGKSLEKVAPQLQQVAERLVRLEEQYKGLRVGEKDFKESINSIDERLAEMEKTYNERLADMKREHEVSMVRLISLLTGAGTVGGGIVGAILKLIGG